MSSCTHVGRSVGLILALECGEAIIFVPPHASKFSPYESHFPARPACSPLYWGIQPAKLLDDVTINMLDRVTLANSPKHRKKSDNSISANKRFHGHHIDPTSIGKRAIIRYRLTDYISLIFRLWMDRKWNDFSIARFLDAESRNRLESEHLPIYFFHRDPNQRVYS